MRISPFHIYTVLIFTGNSELSLSLGVLKDTGKSSYGQLEHLGLILKNLSRRCENFTISYIYCSYFYREFGVEPLIRNLEGHWKEFIRSIGASRTNLEELVQKM